MHSTVWAQQRADDVGGEPRWAPRIAAVGACPGADAVAQTVETLIPHRAIPVPRRGAEVNVADQGDSYRVQVVVEGATHARLYRDVGRDCAHRARVAAVFVALTLMPPELLMESPPTPPPPPLAAPPAAVVAAPPPAPVPRPSWRPSFALAGVLDVAPAVLDAPSIVSPGAELRVGLQKGRVAGELGIGVQPAAGFARAGVSVRQRRVPLDASVVFRQPVRGAIQLGAAAGVAAAAFAIEGVSSPVNGESTRLELGARGAVEVRITSSSRRLSAFLGAHAIYFPRSYELAMTPMGVIGHTPSLWLGGQLGSSLSF
jgi:hypothetical protein